LIGPGRRFLFFFPRAFFPPHRLFRLSEFPQGPSWQSNRSSYLGFSRVDPSFTFSFFCPQTFFVAFFFWRPKSPPNLFLFSTPLPRSPKKNFPFPSGRLGGCYVPDVQPHNSVDHCSFFSKDLPPQQFRPTVFCAPVVVSIFPNGVFSDFFSGTRFFLKSSRFPGFFSLMGLLNLSSPTSGPFALLSE